MSASSLRYNIHSHIPQVGLPKLTSMISEANAVATVNWNSILGMTAIWEGLDRDVFSKLTGARKVFFLSRCPV